MTTGNIVDDYPFVDQFGGPYGLYYRKVWSGGDRSPADKAAGVYPPHSYHCTVYSHNVPLIEWSTNGSQYFQQTASSMGLPSKPDSPFTANVKNAMLNDLYSMVKDGDFNFACFAGESAETLKMLADTTRRIGGAWMQAKKGNFLGAARQLVGRNVRSTTAGNWLELQYGWLPLLGDTYSSMELLANRLHKPARPLTFRVRKRKKLNNGIQTTVTRTYSRTTFQRQVQVQLSEPLSFSQVLGLNDPGTVAWNLLPYSFVLDWFLPIGPWLEAAAAARQLQGLFIETDCEEYVVRGLHSGPVPQPGAYWVRNGERYQYRSKTVTRSVSTYPQTFLPSLAPIKSQPWKRAVNGLALLSQLPRH